MSERQVRIPIDSVTLDGDLTSQPVRARREGSLAAFTTLRLDQFRRVFVVQSWFPLASTTSMMPSSRSTRLGPRSWRGQTQRRSDRPRQ